MVHLVAIFSNMEYKYVQVSESPTGRGPSQNARSSRVDHRLCLRLQLEFRFLGMAKDVSISYLVKTAGFISRLGSVPLVIATEL